MLTTASPPMNRWAEFLQPRKAGRSFAETVAVLFLLRSRKSARCNLVAAEGRAKNLCGHPQSVSPQRSQRTRRKENSGNMPGTRNRKGIRMLVV